MIQIEIPGREQPLQLDVLVLDYNGTPIAQSNKIWDPATNTMAEKAFLEPVKEGDVKEITFTQRMTLQGGEYLLSMSCTGYENGEHVVYHRLYNVAGITVISNKNTVGVYDMESQVAVKLTPAGQTEDAPGRQA